MLLSVTVLVVLVAVVFTIYFGITNLLKKVEQYEDVIQEYETIIMNQQEYVKKVSEIVTESRSLINQIDDRGVFEADDEVGSFFRYLKEIQELLNNFIVVEIDGKSKK